MYGDGMANKERLLEKAQRYLQKGRHKDALKVYEKILNTDPDDDRILLRKGEMEAKLGFLDEAILSYKEVALRYEKEGFYPKAIAIYKKIIKINEEDFNVFMKLGMLYKKLNLDSDAKFYYQKVADHFKANGMKSEYIKVAKLMSEFLGDNFGLKADLAEEFLEQGDLEQATQQFRSLSQSAFENKDIKALDQLIEKMNHLGVADMESSLLHIKTYMQVGEPKKALKIIRKAYSQDPSNTGILEILAKCFKDLGQPQKASAVYEELVHLYKGKGDFERGQQAQKSISQLASQAAPQDLKQEPLAPKLEASIPTGAKVAQVDVPADQSDDLDDLEDLEDLTNFDEVLMSESTLAGQSHKFTQDGQKPKFPNQEGSIESLDFLDSNEILPSDPIAIENVSIECEPFDQALERVLDASAAESSPVPPTTLEPVPDLIDVSHDLKPDSSSIGFEVEQEMDFVLDSIETSSKVMSKDNESQPISAADFHEEDSFVSFSEVSSNTISPEGEISGLEHKTPPKLKASPATDTLFVSEEDSIDDLNNRFENTVLTRKPESSKGQNVAPSTGGDDGLSLDPYLEMEVSPQESIVVGGMDEHIAIPKKNEPKKGPQIDLSFDTFEASKLDDLDISDMKRSDEVPQDAERTLFEPLVKDSQVEKTEVFTKTACNQNSIMDTFSGEISSEEFGQEALPPNGLEATEVLFKNKPDVSGLKASLEPKADSPLALASEKKLKSKTLVKTQLPLSRDAEPQKNQEKFFDLAGSLTQEMSELRSSFMRKDLESEEVQHLSPEEVILEFKKGVARTIDKGDSQTYYDLGVAYKDMGLIDEAIASFKIARTGETYRVDATSLMGICYMDKKTYPEAISAFESVLPHISYQDPKAVGIRYELAQCYVFLGRHPEAYREYKKVLDVDAGFRDAKTRSKELAFNLGIDEQEHKQKRNKMIVNLNERQVKSK